MKCIYCKSKEVKKNGHLKTKRGKTQRYKCKACDKSFTKRNSSVNYRHRKQHLRDAITKMYCERMSLRGIARTLNISYPTVVKYFRENAELARKANKKRLDNKGLITSYIQFDQLETYEHTKRKPVGIQISIRHKTGEIVSAKAGYIPIRALSVSKSYSTEWNKMANQSNHTEKMLQETKKALNPKGSTITCDGYRPQIKLLKKTCRESYVTIQPSVKEHKKIDRVFRRIRQDVSRLGRKTLSTTKRLEQLQNHLDLYTDYHNLRRAA